jgi:O-antigen ligase
MYTAKTDPHPVGGISLTSDPVENSGWRHREPTSRSRSVSDVLISYPVVALIIFFATRGAFSFLADNRNSAIAQIGGTLVGIGVTGEDTFEGRTANGIVWTIVFLLLISERRKIISLLHQNFSTVVLPLVAVSSVFWSQYPSLSLRRGVFLLLSTLFSYYIVARFDPLRQMRLLMLAGLTAAFVSISLVLFFPQFGVDRVAHIGDWQGLFPQKNVCAYAMLLFLSPVFYVGGEIGRASRIGYASILIFILIMTKSRTGWVTALLYFAFVTILYWLGRMRRKDATLMALSFSGALLLLIAILFADLDSILPFLGRDATLSGRTEIWAAVLQSIAKHPFLGYGYSAFWHGLQGESAHIILRLGWVVPHAHNGFLQVWLELGAVGLGLVIYMLVSASRDSIRCFVPSRPQFVDWYISILFFTVVSDISEPHIAMDRQLGWIIFLIACLELKKRCRQSRLSTDLQVPPHQALTEHDRQFLRF